MLKLFLVSFCIIAVSCAPQGIAPTQSAPQNQRIPQPQPSGNPQSVSSGQHLTRNAQPNRNPPIQGERFDQPANLQPQPQQFQPNQFQQQPPQQFAPQQQPPQFQPQPGQQPHPGAQFPPQGPPQGPPHGQLRPQHPQEDGRGPPPGQQFPGSPQIYWGRCPQLEPTMEEKVKKAAVITKCLEVTPVPQNITQETVEVHREQVAACALQMEGWFNDKGLYKYDKAESEIKAKKLTKEIEERILSYHKQCNEEAEEKFPVSNKNLISQIQLYQACMDYFISDVCGIDVLRR